MIKIFCDSKVYIHAPYNFATGGVELLHQLADLLRANDIDAYIIYNTTVTNPVIVDEYKKYNIKVATNIDNNHKNIEVFPEVFSNKIRTNDSTQKILWWLSVDNFFTSSVNYLSIKNWSHLTYKSICKQIIRRAYYLLRGQNLFKNNVSLESLAKYDIINCYQSEYAQYFLQANGLKFSLPLKDYINTDYTNDIDYSDRDDIILYNPKKGLKFTKQLIDLTPNIKWVPLINLNREQLVALMQRAKLYVDFGHHPGKDRLPRECVMNGCCIAVGDLGAANFFGDVPISNRYKFEQNRVSKRDIATRLIEIVNNYESEVCEFDFYRRSIRREHAEFIDQALMLFGK